MRPHSTPSQETTRTRNSIIADWPMGTTPSQITLPEESYRTLPPPWSTRAEPATYWVPFGMGSSIVTLASTWPVLATVTV